MGFLGNRCPTCGWSLDQQNEEETLFICELCGHRKEKIDGHWAITKGNKLTIDDLLQFLRQGKLSKNDLKYNMLLNLGMKPDEINKIKELK